MPKLVEKPVTWGDVRKGDIIDGAKVADVTKKVTWTSILFEGDDENMRLRKRIEHSVVVQREEPTEEEIAERRLEMIRETLIDDLRGLLRRNPVQQLEDVVTSARQREATKGEPVTEVLDWSNLADVLQAQALYKIGVRVNYALRRDDGPEQLDHATYEEIVDAFAAWYASDVDTGRAFSSHVNPLSRSTSALSNMLEDLDAWAVAEVTSRFSWSMARDVIIQRAAELKEEWHAKSTWKSS